MGGNLNKYPMLERALLSRCIKMVIENGVCPDSSVDEMIDAILFSHNKGYLYTNKKANAFVCGYKIPEVNDKWRVTIPEEETGEIFFVNFAVSAEPDKYSLMRMLSGYLDNNPEVKELVYYRRNNDKDFRQIHIRRNDNVE